MQEEKINLDREDSLEKEKIKKEGDTKKNNDRIAYLKLFEEVSPEELEKEVNKEEFTADGSFDDEIKTVELKEGKIVRGTIYSVDENEAILDIGFKSEGTIPINQFENCEEVKHGDEFDVFLEKIENQDGLVVLSKTKADFLKAWTEIKNAYDNEEIAKAKVDRRIKGGLMVKLMGVDAFLPGSQIALRQIPNLEELIETELDVQIIKINKRRRNIVVSRRVVLEKNREKEKEKLLEELEVGQIREGVVKNITDFGAFVDLGGIDGLLHLTDLTWGRISHPSELVAIGDKLKVKILDFDKERERISLGLKQLTPYPWEDVEEKYSVGKKVKGKVVSITDYGAFVELEKGVEGLIHISEMSWTRHVKHPSKVVGICDKVEAVVLSVDKDNEKISLGLKQLEPDPWKSLEKKYSPGTKLTGKVRNLTNFGAFVEIEDGIDGLVHISDMSWAKRVRHPSEVLKKGQEMDVVVLDIDSEKRRISLGIKQIQENPWNNLAEEFSVGSEAEGTITRLLDRGAVVEIKEDVEGFVPLSHMGVPGIKKPSHYFDVGNKLPLKVIKMDPPNKKIVLSVNSFFEDKDEETHKKFLEGLKTPDPAQLEEDEETEGRPDSKGVDDSYDDYDEDIDFEEEESSEVDDEKTPEDAAEESEEQVCEDTSKPSEAETGEMTGESAEEAEADEGVVEVEGEAQSPADEDVVEDAGDEEEKKE